jgi:2-methylcitrate dehydratase PrpD
MSNLAVSERLAVFIKNLEYDNLPKAVIEQAKRCLLDTIGVTLAGFRTETGRTFVSLASEWGGDEEATIFGDGVRVPSPNAALVNGTMGHVLELDDGHRYALGHPGVTSIPAAIAVAEKVGASGEDLLTAIVLGYDIFVRVARAVNPSHRGRGFHTTGTCGTFGAAAAAGKILDLDERGLVNAFGIAGVQAAGLMEVMRGESMIKSLNAGRASNNGVLAALLADQEITAPATIFEGNDGFCRAYSDESDVNLIVDSLGEDYHINGVYTKLHAACRHAHPAIDCALHLAEEHMLTPEEVDRIVVKTYSASYRLTGMEYDPKTASTAKFSLPYCLAAALTYRRVGPDEFSMDKVTDEKMLKLARSVKVQVDPEIDKLAPAKRGTSVELYVKGGRRHIWTVDNPRGEPENPVNNKELKDKFTTLVSPTLGESRVHDIINTLEKLEDINNIRNLTKLLS